MIRVLYAAALALLVELFDTPYAFEDYEDLPRHYYWPSAFVYDSWEEIPPADMEALEQRGLLPAADGLLGHGNPRVPA